MAIDPMRRRRAKGVICGPNVEPTIVAVNWADKVGRCWGKEEEMASGGGSNMFTPPRVIPATPLADEISRGSRGTEPNPLGTMSDGATPIPTPPKVTPAPPVVGAMARPAAAAAAAVGVAALAFAVAGGMGRAKDVRAKRSGGGRTIGP